MRVRLIEIGEAVRAIDQALVAREPDIPWIDVAGMRNHLAHRYFDTAHSIVQATVTDDLPPLAAATKRLLNHLGSEARGADSAHAVAATRLMRIGSAPTTPHYANRSI